MNADLVQVFFAAMTPIGELRLSIPLGVWGLEEPWLWVLLISMAGNMVPVLPLLLGLNRASTILARFPGPAARLLAWRAERIRAAHTDRFDRYGALVLVLLVGIPLPLTGAWTGSLAAWVFQIPLRLALPAIGAGVLLAGGIVTAVVLAGIQASVILAG